jgi:hypothetical protein
MDMGTTTHQAKNTVVGQSAKIHMSMIVTIVMMKMGAMRRTRSILRAQIREA